MGQEYRNNVVMVSIAAFSTGHGVLVIEAKSLAHHTGFGIDLSGKNVRGSFGTPLSKQWHAPSVHQILIFGVILPPPLSRPRCTLFLHLL